MKKRAKKSTITPTLHTVCRVLLGAVFMFSGFVKAVDPLGTAYKIQDYFTAFGPFFAQFNAIALILSMALFTVEFVVGFGLFFNFKIKFSSVTALLFMLVMTPLTLYIALKNPVKDCGCFGDAIVISNWATFGKNIVLLLLAITTVATVRNNRPLWAKWSEWTGWCIGLAIPIVIAIYCYVHLPIIDFRPYKVGINIIEAMTLPADAKSDVYETTFIYSRNGVEQEFTLENYPDESEGWVFIEQRSKLIEKGDEPAIHDFSITTTDGDDITYEVLEQSGYTFLLIAYDITSTNQEHYSKANEIAQLAHYSDIPFYALTASTDDDVAALADATQTSFTWCKTDPITLKTIVRANPGLLLIKDGVVMAKWNGRDIPSATEMQDKFLK